MTTITILHGEMKDIASSVNQEVFQSTQMMKHAVQGVHVQLSITHIKRTPHSAVYEGSYRYVTEAIELLHGATLSRECCHNSFYRCVVELHFCQPVLSSQELTQSCMV